MIAFVAGAQAAPVSSWGTYHVAYTLVAVIYCGYTLSLWTRARRFRRSIEQAGVSPRG
jgi:hypothetical protein